MFEYFKSVKILCNISAEDGENMPRSASKMKQNIYFIDFGKMLLAFFN